MPYHKISADMYKFTELSEKAKQSARDWYLVIYQIGDNKLTNKQIDKLIITECDDWRFMESGRFILFDY